MILTRFHRYLDLDGGHTLPRHIFVEPKCFSASAAMSTTTETSEQTTASSGGAASTATSGNNAPAAGVGSTQTIAGGNLTVNSTSTTSEDPAVINDSLNTVEDLIGQALQSSGANAQNSNSALLAESDNLSELLNQVMTNGNGTANLATTETTASSSSWLWIVGIAAVVLLFVNFSSRPAR
jgi:hypothetical protein